MTDYDRKWKRMPMSSEGITKEALFEALRALVGAQPIQERLTFAADAMTRGSRRDHVPAAVAEKFHAVVAALTKTPLSDNSGHRPRQVTAREGEELAHEILDMFVKIMGGL